MFVRRATESLHAPSTQYASWITSHLCDGTNGMVYRQQDCVLPDVYQKTTYLMISALRIHNVYIHLHIIHMMFLWGPWFFASLRLHPHRWCFHDQWPEYTESPHCRASWSWRPAPKTCLSANIPAIAPRVISSKHHKGIRKECWKRCKGQQLLSVFRMCIKTDDKIATSLRTE